MAARPPNEGHPKPDVGDTLLVIHDFLARSSDELSLVKGDRVELIERDDEFGDGWFLGKHLANGNSGLFPEAKKDDVPSQPQPSISGPSFGSLNSLEAGPDSHVLHETLNVIDEHITDLRSPPSSGGLRAATNDSGSEYSTQLDHRLSYIQGEETDEEEEGAHSRLEVEAWSPDQVAEHLFTAGVEKHHCEVFRDQEITGDVLLGMDQSSLFIKAFDLGGAHSKKNSYADEQRVRSATAISRHSRYGSIDAPREGAPSAAAQKYYGLQSGPHKRATSTSTTRSIPRVPSIREAPSPVVTKLDSASRDLPVVSGSPASRHNVNSDWLASLVNKPTVKIGGLRATSDISSGERARITSPVDTTVKDSPLPSPAPTGSSTPSAGPSFDLDSPGNGKMSPSTTTTAASKSSRRKGKKETSAYQRGLQKIGPKEAMKDADYSGWMKKKSSNLMTTWKPRLFVLKGRRLAYYYSEDDQQEKGLIDISFHRVLPADNEKLTGLHATLTGAGSAAAPAASTLAQPEVALDKGDDSMFIFKLVPPRTGLTRAVNFTKPTVHYFAVPNLQQGRLWMAALVKATIDRDDTQPITTTYQQKTISLAKARAMRHRPPALMNLDETPEEDKKNVGGSNKDANLLGIHFGETDSGVSGLEKPGPAKVESANAQKLFFDAESSAAPPPQSA
ncbi:Protein BOI2 like protein [Verticillium longisporum]|nr:Protein BOI2 like protein [Verticillium longisporum]